MSSLNELRKEIDQIDDQIVELYEKRMDVIGEIGDVKIQNGKKMIDMKRENDILAKVSNHAKTPFAKKGVHELYEQILAMSRKLQYQKLVEAGAIGKLPFIGIDSLDSSHSRIVFPGTKGAHSQAAMEYYFGKNCNNFYVKTFREAMEAIEEGSADYAVLPIENSTAGSVDEMYDLLVEFENYIVGETIIPITHILAALPGTKLEDIKTVYSKNVALLQTSYYLDDIGADWRKISVANTAIAAQKVRDDKDISQAAVCSKVAAEAFGLDILNDNINNDEKNSTRFIVICNQKVFLRDAKKISICFELPHESGSLYRILSHFIYNDLNMTKIESRPVEGKSWEYRFFIDFEGNLAEPGVKNAIRGLRQECRGLKILGNY